VSYQWVIQHEIFTKCLKTPASHTPIFDQIFVEDFKIQILFLITPLYPSLANSHFRKGFFNMEQQPPKKSWPPHHRGFAIKFKRTTFIRALLDGWSARIRDLLITKPNTKKIQTSMPAVRFETAIPASEWPQTHALDLAAGGIYP